ncbi:DUF1801 domain-containing protein [Simiduia curdlanivorans]|uniref:DUF1801 domain-containing protein n=1 Tax=Simiduia curdlanivorans TaxID=1492769 RepID=A0ABV8V1J4_9GAMM|nr:DUF1801 domain-containing protein [Simiduia curdlanivorans]MDN3640483.1 DUF1801 domain-containing protein [Simiduia curdlanivorans]
MISLKTQPSKQSVVAFIQRLEHAVRRSDALQLLTIFQDITREKPVLWGDSIIGFGNYLHTTLSGDSYPWFYTGFSPRKQNLTLYINCSLNDVTPLLAALGKHKTSVACLYINKLADVDIAVLRQLIASEFAHRQGKNQSC